MGGLLSRKLEVQCLSSRRKFRHDTPRDASDAWPQFMGCDSDNEITICMNDYK